MLLRTKGWRLGGVFDIGSTVGENGDAVMGKGRVIRHAPASRKEHWPIDEDTSGEENIPAGGKLSATKAKNKRR